jgi:hypothetical protein
VFAFMVGLLAALVSCQNPSRGGSAPSPQPPPAAPPAPGTATQPAPASQPAPTPPSPQVATSAPAEPPASPHAPGPEAQTQELPDYIEVLERYHPAEAARVSVQLDSPRRLIIDTQNVRRLRIDRNKLPLSKRGHIILRLDEQGIEWRAGSSTDEFERSVNGDWTPVKQRQP